MFCRELLQIFWKSVLNLTALKHFGFWYDSSRDQIDDPRSFDLLKRLSHRLIAGHLSDRIIESVDHVTIGEGFIDFDSMIDLLNPLNMKFPLFMKSRRRAFNIKLRRNSWIRRIKAQSIYPVIYYEHYPRVTEGSAAFLLNWLVSRTASDHSSAALWANAPSVRVSFMKRQADVLWYL